VEELIMNDDQYSIANLKPDQVDENQKVEQRLTEKLGQPITLIAYQMDSVDIIKRNPTNGRNPQ
jgi:hypothetical protein